MNAAALIELSLTLVQSVLSQLKNTGAEAAIVADVQAAVDALLKVHGTDVTYQQLESLRVKPTF
jgi:hypothetical protein